jgi:hypothetical protein
VPQRHGIEIQTLSCEDKQVPVEKTGVGDFEPDSWNLQKGQMST